MFFACKVWCIAVVSSISPSSKQTLYTLPFEIALERKCCIKYYEKSSLKTVTCSSLPIFLCNRVYLFQFHEVLSLETQGTSLRVAKKRQGKSKECVESYLFSLHKSVFGLITLGPYLLSIQDPAHGFLRMMQ